jgi:chromosome segregation ATPase
MCKKVLVLALIAAGGFVAYRHFNGNFCLGEEPLEKQIQRERDKLPQLDAEIRKYISQVATREIDVKNLAAEIKQLEEQQLKNRDALKTKKAELQANASLIKEGAKADPDHQRALRDLDRQANAFTRAQAELKAKKEQLEAFKEALNAAHEELVAYQNERRSLETELAQLDAMLAQTRAEEVKARIHFDKSKLAERTKSITVLRNRVEVRQKELELQGRYLGTASQPVSKTDTKTVFEKVDELIGPK